MKLAIAPNLPILAFRVADEAHGPGSLAFCDLSVEGLAHLGRV